MPSLYLLRPGMVEMWSYLIGNGNGFSTVGKTTPTFFFDFLKVKELPPENQGFLDPTCLPSLLREIGLTKSESLLVHEVHRIFTTNPVSNYHIYHIYKHRTISTTNQHRFLDMHHQRPAVKPSKKVSNIR